MRSIREIGDIQGKRVLVRADINLPIKDGVVEDDFRVQKTMPLVKFLQEKSAKIILITHVGKSGETAAPVAQALGKFTKVTFVPEVIGSQATKAVEDMKNGEVVLLENLRQEEGEKGCDQNFAESLAKLGDIYVNEAFPVNHREDASIVLLPKLLPAYAGFQLEEEINNLSKAFDKPKHPFLFILGGAKFSTKMPLIEKYLELADHVFIGGALANDFFKAKGYEVGQSLTDCGDYNLGEVFKNKKLILPIDVVVQSGDQLINKKVDEVGADEIIIDIGSETVKNLAPFINESQLILWNGPLGKYEAGGGCATKEILKMVAGSKAESIVGGGDTVALISEMKIEDKFSFVSTGGGATLDFLVNGTLPGIKALE